LNLQRQTYISVSSKGVPIRNIADYSPFGVQLDGRTISMESYRYGYQGSEKDDESKGGGNSYTTFFRQLDPRVGRWFSIDPVFQPWQSPYSSMDGNPISLIDILGSKSESTHIDEKGKVIAVFDDGDNGVYQHNTNGKDISKKQLQKKHDDFGTSLNGKKVGETKYWDEFLVPRSDGKKSNKIAENTQIRIGEDWSSLIEWGNNYANKCDLTVTMERSKNKKILDIKENENWCPESSGGMMTGRLLNGKYATGRSAGNYLAGMNGVTGTLQGVHISGTTYMKLAGAYQLGLLTNYNIFRVMSFGTQFGPAPYYGEMEYSGRRIAEGIEAGKNKMKSKNKKK